MKKYGTDHFTCDRAKIISENDHFIKIRAAITAVGVYEYPDGRAFKSRRALLAATPFVKSAKLTVKEHPTTMVVMNQKDIVGYCEKPYFERDRIWAVLTYRKKSTPKQYIDALHNSNLKADVSIGFYYTYVPIPGEYKGKAYDYRMEDIVIDHVASFVPKGRCTYPTCGIGVDQSMKRLFQTDKVVKRGNKWCIEHTHGAKAGTLIKGSCHANKSETEAMHRAIEASKMRAGRDAIYNRMIYGDQDERPPKAWMDNCKRRAAWADDPGAYCGFVWYHGSEALKRSFGASSVQKIIGGKKGLSEETGEGLVITPEDFEKCVKQRLEEYPEMTREEAEALCKPVTKPEDEPIPPGGTLTDQEQTPYQQCIVKYTSEPHNLSLEEAIEKCKEEGHIKEDQDAAFENCVTRKMEEGMTREEAEKTCRAEHPVEAEDQDDAYENCVTRLIAEGKTRVEAEKQCRIEHPVTDQEEEPTPLEKCIANKTEEGMTNEEATEWCEAELAGEHEKPEDLIATSQKLLQLKRERDTNRQIEARRNR